MGIKVGGKEVGHSKLGAFAEELGTGLEVRDTAVKVKGMTLECGKFRSKEGCDEIGTANRLAKVTGPGGKLGVRGKDCEGLAEVVGVGRREGRGGTGNGGENFSFGKTEVDAVRATKAAEFGDIIGKVNVAEAGASVVEAGEADCGRKRVTTGSGTGGKGGVEFGKDFVEH
jgi:hypothetical protein